MSAGTTAILYAPGTNCHEETAAAIECAGGQSELVLLHDLIEGRARLADFQAAIIPGGFAYGDHLGAGRIFGVMLVARLREQLVEFLEAGKPLLGICNGFQVLAEAGILPGRSPGQRGMALLENATARFEDRKISLVVSHEKSPWTEGLEGEILRMPTAHGEGRPLFCGTASLVAAASPPSQLKTKSDDADIAATARATAASVAAAPLREGGASPPSESGDEDIAATEPVRIVLRYSDAEGKPTTHYPENPNGAPAAVAGLTDSTGTVLGLMPHPERASLPAHYSQDGLRIFKNLIRWLSR